MKNIHLLPIPTFYCCLALLLVSITAHSQIITTIAGTGTAGYSGDGGPASAANMNNCRIVFDAVGNLYITDARNNRIRKVDRAGTITTFAGRGTAGFSGDGGPATAAELNTPNGISIDHAGNIYFADQLNDRIRKIDPGGTISTIAGNGIPAYGGDGGMATNASLTNPAGIVVSASGDMYIHSSDYRIRKINAAGVITTIAGTGVAGYSGDGGAATLAMLNVVAGIAVDIIGNLYFSDMLNNRIRKIDGAGIVTTFAGTGIRGYGGDGGPASVAEFSYPSDLAIDQAGNLYITDLDNRRIRKISAATWIVATFAGNGSPGFSGDGGAATAASINFTAGLAFDCADNLYVSDINNCRIRIVAVDNAPAFTRGATQSLYMCGNTSASADTMLEIADVDAGQTETWTVTRPPAHGLVLSSYSATSTGALLIPTGFNYTPVAGYTGNDTFTVQVSDCSVNTGTTTVYVKVTDCSLGNALVGGQTGASLWPNPASGLLHIEGNATTYAICTMAGTTVLQGNIARGGNTVAIATLPAGIYTVWLTGSGGERVVKKLVKD